jgi:hypothetical protein
MIRAVAKSPAVLAVGVIACLGVASPALGATVSVSEDPGITTKATLHFDAAPGESNDVSVAFEEASPTEFRVSVSDQAGGLASGRGCAVQGSSGKSVTCSLHKPHPVEYILCGRSCAQAIPGSGWETSISAALGDGDNSFQANPPGTGDAAIGITVTAGDGNDTIATAEGRDRVEAGSGKDEIHTNGGEDWIVAPATPDGADLYDLGADNNVIDYSARSAPVVYSPDGEGNAGAPKEGDTVRGAGVVLTGSGDDVLNGGPGGERLLAGGGNDQLRGGGGGDELFGEGGENQLFGEDGNDKLSVERNASSSPGSAVTAPNLADGGAGDDHIYLAAGPDRASGGPGIDVIKAGDGDDVVAGGPGEDEIYGDDGADLLAGEADRDTLVGNKGPDRMLGGPGNDRLVAGVVTYNVPGDWGLTPRGPFDGWRDRGSCGSGNDIAVANPWDALRDCERTVSIQAVELRRPRRTDPTGPRLLPVVINGPGRLVLDGPAIRKRDRRVAESAYGRPYFHDKNKILMLPLTLSPDARLSLHRHGRLRLRIDARFFPAGGVPRTAHRSFLLVGD